ncbi:MAG: SAM-dependent chlorinase/fluorinase, partial [Candidatus Zixiibacteriota bacterium]
FSFLEEKQIRKAISVSKKKYFLKDVSPTFHGRDIFAPVAAYLSRGVAPEEFGRPVSPIIRQTQSRFKRTKRGFSGRIIYIDHFGNLVTSFRESDLPKDEGVVFLNDTKVGRLRRTFGSVGAGRPLCYINSFGYLEIAVNRGSASEYYSVSYSSDVNILIAPP